MIQKIFLNQPTPTKDTKDFRIGSILYTAENVKWELKGFAENGDAIWVDVFSAGVEVKDTEDFEDTIFLTATSEKIQRISMFEEGYCLSLPDATTMSTAINCFRIENTGKCPFYITDCEGKILATLKPHGKVNISLVDNNTIGGIWTGDYNDASIGVLHVGDWFNYLTNINPTSYYVFRIDDDRVCFIYRANLQQTFNVKVFNITTGESGNPIEIEGYEGQFAGCMIGVNKAVIVFGNARFNGSEAVIVTFNGTITTQTNPNGYLLSEDGMCQNIKLVQLSDGLAFFTATNLASSKWVSVVIRESNNTLTCTDHKIWDDFSNNCRLNICRLTDNQATVVSHMGNQQIYTVTIYGNTWQIDNIVCPIGDLELTSSCVVGVTNNVAFAMYAGVNGLTTTGCSTYTIYGLAIYGECDEFLDTTPYLDKSVVCYGYIDRMKIACFVDSQDIVFINAITIDDGSGVSDYTIKTIKHKWVKSFEYGSNVNFPQVNGSLINPDLLALSKDKMLLISRSVHGGIIYQVIYKTLL